jgi:D-alanine-D-alanine ligase
MNMDYARTDLPVLLLYNINHTWSSEEIKESHTIAKALYKALRGEGHPVNMLCIEDQDVESILKDFPPDDYIVFNWLEELPGLPNSYSQAARVLEIMGFTYTGADSQALAFTQDKRLVKQQLDRCGVTTPRWRIYTRPSHNGWKHFPAIVKPAFEHCSYGVTRDAVVWTPEELSERVTYVVDTFKQPALVEEFIDGRELHVTIVGNGTLHVLPPAEMDFSAFANANDRLCSFESKFDPGSSSYNLIELRLPAPLTDEEFQTVSQTAIQAYRATNCRDYARLDVRLRDGVCYVLDVNPNADISPDTSIVLSAKAAGMSYGQLGSLLINLAARRHRIYGAMPRLPVPRRREKVAVPVS